MLGHPASLGRSSKVAETNAPLSGSNNQIGPGEVAASTGSYRSEQVPCPKVKDVDDPEGHGPFGKYQVDCVASLSDRPTGSATDADFSGSP
jgi:hypothetical protein